MTHDSQALPEGIENAATHGPLKVWGERGGRLLRLRLAKPKANLIDAAMIAALREAFTWNHGRRGMLAVILDHEGPHFSFGASVEEHLPAQCAEMLAGLHKLVIQMVDFPVPILVAIRGQCLGGGLEVAMAGGMLFAAPNAMLGQPEIKLGVFAPAASVLLPERVGQIFAEDLLFSGRSIGAAEAQSRGLVHTVADDPEAAALAWFDANLAMHSGAAVACAVTAVRAPYVRRIRERIARVESLYLERLMRTHDAVEGLNAFIAKRAPTWAHH